MFYLIVDKSTALIDFKKKHFLLKPIHLFCLIPFILYNTHTLYILAILFSPNIFPRKNLLFYLKPIILLIPIFTQPISQ